MFIHSNGNEANDSEDGRVDDDHGLDRPSDDHTANDGSADNHDTRADHDASHAEHDPLSRSFGLLADDALGQLLPSG